MKTGANMNDRNRIRELTEEGLNAEEISTSLGIALLAVKSFMPKSSSDGLDGSDDFNEEFDLGD